MTAPLQRPPGDDPPLPQDAVEVGRVVGAWGTRGAIKVKPFAAEPRALFSSKRWFIEPPEVARPAGPGRGPQGPRLLRVIGAKEQGDGIVATAHELADRDAAEAMKGMRVFVSRASFPTPGEGEFYWVDLIGLSVVNRQGAVLGSVAGLIETGPHCVLRVRGAATAASETLIPFVDAYVDAVEAGERRIRVDWDPEG